VRAPQGVIRGIGWVNLLSIRRGFHKTGVRYTRLSPDRLLRVPRAARGLSPTPLWKNQKHEWYPCRSSAAAARLTGLTLALTLSRSLKEVLSSLPFPSEKS